LPNGAAEANPSVTPAIGAGAASVPSLVPGSFVPARFAWSEGAAALPFTSTPNLVVYVSTPPGPTPAEVSEWSKPATYTSILALLVSIGVVVYTLWKDSRARKHSVEDDYWLRKVVGPIAIEPLLKDILEMISAAPGDATSPAFSGTEVDTYHAFYVGKLSALAMNSVSLQIIDKQLASVTASAIDQIQDLMIDYCFRNKSMNASGVIIPGYDKATFQGAAKDKLVDLLKPIREYQVKKVGR
jgi:hypothetical protein